MDLGAAPSLGILFLLKLVAMPASIITMGIVHGVLNPITTMILVIMKIILVIELSTAFLYKSKVALAIKPIILH